MSGMYARIFSFAILGIALIPQLPAPAAEHRFTAERGGFQLDGKPYQVISGEMHYPRIPREYWRARFRMARAMGLNTVTTYVFWNVHEPSPGVFDFSGNNDIAEFIREAGQEGLHVILRPGPYVCAEWEFGGFPAWLLKDPAVVVRSTDPRFLAATQRWFRRLGQELAALHIQSGGPIIAVQVENEYGSFGKDREYLRAIRSMMSDAGLIQSLPYTADGPEQVPDGSFPDVPVGINFGGSDSPHAAEGAFEMLKKLRPDGPFLNSEYWDGWFDHWGGKHASTSSVNQAANLDFMLRHGYSISLYMFHGGTSFGWMNGANSDGKNYEPDVTSYDYDSPLDESGRTVSKYFTFRDLIAKATGTTPPPVPEVPAAARVPEFALPESVSLWDALPKPVHSEKLLAMEDLDQAYGYILYRTQVHGPLEGDLKLDALHDYARIYLDGKPVGKLDRRLGQDRLTVKVTGPDVRLDILVENTGRVNFTTALRGERKGITREVSLAGTVLTGWDIYSLPMTDTASLPFRVKRCEGPCFYRGAFRIEEPADTFLDTTSVAKGSAWVNGRNLGRIWNIGPQKALYLPGPWLNAGANTAIVFDLEGRPGRTLRGLDHPALGDK